MSQRIPLTRGLSTLVDDHDFVHLSMARWLCTSKGFAARFALVEGKKRMIYLHRLLLNAPPHLQVDHVNGDTLDNRRQNLRLVTPQQNRMNGKGTLSSSDYKGVTRYGQRWQARISLHNKTRHLGYHETPLVASLVYDHAARRFFGAFARLNHPEIPPLDYFDQLLDQILAGTRPPKAPERKRIPRVPKARSRYRGVYWERGRWRATLCVNGHKQHLGYFGSELEAAHAYDDAAREHLGARARVNFP